MKAIKPLVGDILDEFRNEGMNTFDTVVVDVTRSFVDVGDEMQTVVVSNVSVFGQPLDTVNASLNAYVDAADPLETIVNASKSINETGLMAQVEALKDAIDSCITANDTACKDLDKAVLVDPIDVR